MVSKILIWKQITTEPKEMCIKPLLFPMVSKILIWKQITTVSYIQSSSSALFPMVSKILIWKQITTLFESGMYPSQLFPMVSKILIWKQITTSNGSLTCIRRLFPMVSKILIWKQITTKTFAPLEMGSCFQWFKDTNLKANHNLTLVVLLHLWVVSNGSKILIWKQITTGVGNIIGTRSCFQWFKDTNLKANHNSLRKV